MTNAFVFERLIAQSLPDKDVRTLRILDLGCGQGGLVRELCAKGLDAYGCEIEPSPKSDDADWVRPTDFAWDGLEGRCRRIGLDPYRLPYEDEAFDVVLSNHVLEHVLDKPSVLAEIKRISAPGAMGIHIFPSKFWLPLEPHIHVPLASWLWPKIPRAWFYLWAYLGIRNGFQKGLNVSETVAANVAYARHGIDYQSLDYYRDRFRALFGAFEDLGPAYLAMAPGGSGKLVQKLPFGHRIAPIVSVFRERCLAHRKTAP